MKLATLQRADEVTRSTKARTARVIHALLTGNPDATTAPLDVLTEARAGDLVRRQTSDSANPTGHTLTQRVRTAVQPPAPEKSP